MSHHSWQLYVARHKATKLYTNRMLNFFMGQQEWATTLDPAEELAKMREQVDYIATRRPIWTSDMQEADTWSNETIDRFGKYLEDVEFIPVTLEVA